MSQTRVVAFLSQKGGTGKTTLAVHTAVAAQEAGRRVVLLDTDPQKSAGAWRDARGGADPVVATATASEMDRVIDAAMADRMDLIIVDTAPHATPDAASIARRAHLVLIPCRPSAFDLAAAAAPWRSSRPLGSPRPSCCPHVPSGRRRSPRRGRH